MFRRPPRSTLFPYPTLSRSEVVGGQERVEREQRIGEGPADRLSAHGLEGGERDCSEWRSEEHTSELQSRPHLVCRLLLEKKKIYNMNITSQDPNNAAMSNTP